MQFQFTPDQQDLITASHAMLVAENPLARLRKISHGETVPMLWSRFSEMGLLSLLLPEDQGGIGQDFVVMTAIAESAGYVCLAETMVEQAGLAYPALSAMGETEILDRTLAGKVFVNLLSPQCPYIEAGAYDYFIHGERLIAADNVILDDVATIDPLRKLAKAQIAPHIDERVDERGAADDEALTARGAVLAAAQLVGLSQRMIDMAIDYAKERKQFGTEIGSFQAVKHHLASVYTQIEFTRPIVQLAAVRGGVHIHNAKISAIDTAMLAAETAIQIFGGMGYTFEVDLHLFMKRAWSLCGDWGDRSYHMRALEDKILSGAMPIGPAESFNVKES